MENIYLDCINEKGDIINKDVYAWKLGVFERDNGECKACSNDTEVDVHLIDESKGCTVNNGVVLCEKCYREYKRQLNGLGNWFKLESFLKSKGKTLRTPIIRNNTQE
jgi:predicted nucleic acid-binding Zn ribbon protein